MEFPIIDVIEFSNFPRVPDDMDAYLIIEGGKVILVMTAPDHRETRGKNNRPKLPTDKQLVGDKVPPSLGGRGELGLSGIIKRLVG